MYLYKLLVTALLCESEIQFECLSICLWLPNVVFVKLMLFVHERVCVCVCVCVCVYDMLINNYTSTYLAHTPNTSCMYACGRTSM